MCVCAFLLLSHQIIIVVVVVIISSSSSILRKCRNVFAPYICICGAPIGGSEGALGNTSCAHFACCIFHFARLRTSSALGLCGLPTRSLAGKKNRRGIRKRPRTSSTALWCLHTFMHRRPHRMLQKGLQLLREQSREDNNRLHQTLLERRHWLRRPRRQRPSTSL